MKFTSLSRLQSVLSAALIPALAAITILASCQESFDDRLTREAHDQTRRNCPRRIDPGTILDSITYDRHSREWSYCYSLIDSLDRDEVLDPEMLEDFHERLSRSVANDLSMRHLKSNGITIVYSYRRRSTGVEAIREVFTAEDYGQ